MKLNQDLREKIQSKGFHYYELALEMQISENSMYRWLRSNLTADKKAKIENALEKLEEKRYQQYKKQA